MIDRAIVVFVEDWFFVALSFKLIVVYALIACLFC